MSEGDTGSRKKKDLTQEEGKGNSQDDNKGKSQITGRKKK